MTGKLPLIEDTFSEVEGAIRSAVAAAESRLQAAVGARLRELEARASGAEARRAEAEGALLQSEGEASRVTNLYVALAHLHHGLDPAHVLAAIGEVVTNLIGAEQFVLLFRFDPITSCEIAMARGVGPTHPHFGRGSYSGGDDDVDAALFDGLARYGDGGHVAIAPLLAGDATLGAIVVLRLFEHKPLLFEEDRELLALLGAHAGIALGAARAFVADERTRRTVPVPRVAARSGAAMESQFDALLGEFVAETAPLADSVTHALLAMESGDLNARELATVTGHLHTIKGNAAMMGLDGIALVAHAMEDVCARRALDAWAIERLLDGAALLVALVGDAAAESARRPEAESYAAGVRLSEPPDAPSAASAQVVTAPTRVNEDAVRVDFARLEELADLGAEAHAAQAALATFARSPAEEDALASLGKAIARLRETTLAMRLVPIGRVLERFRRFARDLARERGQAIDLVVEGAGTLIDKAVVDRLFEPLVQLVRNAVAHGIESAEERVSRGKPESAVLRLAASVAGRSMNLVVEDDGRGLAVERIREKAHAMGIDVASFDDAAARRLIFLPGFSTASAVTSIAGRGVGLDVVAASIRAMGGAIDVASEPGRGARFTLTVPITMTTMRALVARAGSATALVPMTAADAVIDVRAGSLTRVAGLDVVRYGPALAPVIDVARALGARGGQGARACIVASVGREPVGLLVDDVSGHGEFLVRPMDPELAIAPWVAGAALLADGALGVLLDVRGLARATRGEGRA